LILLKRLERVVIAHDHTTEHAEKPVVADTPACVIYTQVGQALSKAKEAGIDPFAAIEQDSQVLIFRPSDTSSTLCTTSLYFILPVLYDVVTTSV